MNEVATLITDPVGKILYAITFGFMLFLFKKYDKAIGDSMDALKATIEALKTDIKDHKRSLCNTITEYEASLDRHYKKTDGDVRSISDQIMKVNHDLKVGYSELASKTGSLNTKVELMIGDVKHANAFVREHYGKIIWIEETYRKNGRHLQEVKNGLAKSEGNIKELEKRQEEIGKGFQQAKKIFTAYGKEIKEIKTQLAGNKKERV